MKENASVTPISSLGETAAFLAAANGDCAVLGLLWTCAPSDVMKRLSFAVVANGQGKHTRDELMLMTCAAAWLKWQGKLEDSRRIYRQLLATADDKAFILYEMAESYAAQQETSPEGITLLKSAVENSKGQSVKPYVAKLIWRYDLSGDYQQALELARKLRPELNEAQIEPGWLHVAHAFLLGGKPEEAKEAMDIYNKFSNRPFPDGTLWDRQVVADLSLLRWYGNKIDIIGKAATDLKLKLVDIDCLHKPTELSGAMELLRADASALCGTWRCEEPNYGKVNITVFNVLHDGTAMSSIEQSDGTLLRTVYSSWKIGEKDGDKLLGECAMDNGAINIEKFRFFTNSHEEQKYLLTTVSDFASPSFMSQHLYRKISN
jgi:hypothetical protein